MFALEWCHGHSQHKVLTEKPRDLSLRWSRFETELPTDGRFHLSDSDDGSFQSRGLCLCILFPSHQLMCFSFLLAGLISHIFSQVLPLGSPGLPKTNLCALASSCRRGCWNAYRICLWLCLSAPAQTPGTEDHCSKRPGLIRWPSSACIPSLQQPAHPATRRLIQLVIILPHKTLAKTCLSSLALLFLKASIVSSSHIFCCCCLFQFGTLYFAIGPLPVAFCLIPWQYVKQEIPK